MRALITGASSGIGRGLAKELAEQGYDIIIVARSIDKLNSLQDEIISNNKVNVDIVQLDLSKKESCINLYNQFKGQVDLLINNAGFGTYGKFDEVDLETEINLINTNITAVHILTKLFLHDMKAKNSGTILNVASIAGFLPGPLMAAYYASKSYVVRLSQAIKAELKHEKSNVKVSILCPGPVATDFNKVAKVKFSSKQLSTEYVVKYTLKKLKRNKFYIVPGASIRALRHVCKIVPDNIMAKMVYGVKSQEKLT